MFLHHLIDEENRSDKLFFASILLLFWRDSSVSKQRSPVDNGQIAVQAKINGLFMVWMAADRTTAVRSNAQKWEPEIAWPDATLRRWHTIIPGITDETAFKIFWNFDQQWSAAAINKLKPGMHKPTFALWNLFSLSIQFLFSFYSV